MYFLEYGYLNSTHVLLNYYIESSLTEMKGWMMTR